MEQRKERDEKPKQYHLEKILYFKVEVITVTEYHFEGQVELCFEMERVYCDRGSVRTHKRKMAGPLVVSSGDQQRPASAAVTVTVSVTTAVTTVRKLQALKKLQT